MNTAPPCGPSATSIVPPCRRAFSSAIAVPRPLPCPLSSAAPRARAASGGSWSASSSRTVATIVIAASGVRSSCDTSATKRRAFAAWFRSGPWRAGLAATLLIGVLAGL